MSLSRASDSFHSAEAENLEDWKARAERLFEEIQNYEIGEELLDDLESLVNETVQMKTENESLMERVADMERELFFVKSENAVFKTMKTRENATSLAIVRGANIEVCPCPQQQISNLWSTSGPALPIQTISSLPLSPPCIPQAPVLQLTPRTESARLNPAGTVSKPKYKLLFWTKKPAPSSDTVFHPLAVLVGFHLEKESLDKFLLGKGVAAPGKKETMGRGPVNVLSMRRALTICTAVKALGMSPEQIVSKLVTCDPSLCADYEKLSLLYNALPRDDDLSAVQPLLQDPSLLPGQAEQFIISVSSVSGVRNMLDSIVFKAAYEMTKGELELCLENWRRISQFLIENGELKTVLQVVLAIGNALNEGHPRLSGAFGYGLDLLPDLGNLRSPSDSSSILELVLTQYFRVRGEKAKFYRKEEAQILKEVASANFSALQNSFQGFIQQYDAASKADYSPQFHAVMSEFVRKTASDISRIRQLYLDCCEGIKTCHRYFLEPEETDGEGCFLLFQRLSKFYEQCESIFGKMSVGKTSKRSSKRYTFTPSDRLSLRRRSKALVD